MGGLLITLHFSTRPNLGKSTSPIILGDYDYRAEKAVEMFSKRWPFVSKFRWPRVGRLKGKVKRVEVWRTCHGLHIYVYLKVILPDLLLNVIQYALGSDFRREALNFGRIMEDTKNDANLLYCEKWAARRDGYEIRSRETFDRRLTRKLHGIVFHRSGGRGRRKP
jgi:hypothetical protein